MKAAIGIAGVFVGCMSNVVFLELLVKEDPGSGNLITFLQFLFIALEGFIFTSKFGTHKLRIGLKDYMVLVIMFFVVSVCNNLAFDFNVPMPLHIIFRSGSLITNMIMGIIILSKRYPLSKYVSVCMITLGIILCTIVSGKEVKSTATRGPPTTPYEDFFWWTVGIILLTVALFISARMGIYQEVLYTKHGKHSKEALFCTHALPLPFFALVGNNIYEHWLIALESEAVEVVSNIYIPKMVLYLIGNVLSQYVCISSVYFLTAECSSLVVTLVVTLRKFASLLFSVIYFDNPFTMMHWCGTLLVFIGTVVFTELDKKVLNSFKDKSKGQIKKKD